MKGYVDLAPDVATREERTEVVQRTVQRLADNGLISLKPAVGADEMCDVWELRKPRFQKEPLLQVCVCACKHTHPCLISLP